jgi:2-polyprenyl-3-methyl-5-hydroxy-6-metoxy-1,4-benzoquinol methylase
MNNSAHVPVKGPVSSQCLLCGGDGEEVQHINVDRIVAQWKAKLRINIRGELEGIDSISEHQCRRCGLLYYLPTAAGSEDLYRQLQQFPWYYANDKWEHRTALRDIPPGAEVLEVGCGFGGFLDLVREKRHADAKGIDLNSSAVEVARDLGRPVTVADVTKLVSDQPERYDVVCNFQVLEHVTNPRPFLEACVGLLKPGGRLCIGVPNNDGYLGQQPPESALLNQPPHHITRWGMRTLTSLGALFPLRLRRISFEPLNEMHVPEYITAQLDAIDRVLKRRLRRTGTGLVTSLALTRLGLRHLLRGHTVYASYTRLPFGGARAVAAALVGAEALLALGSHLGA